MRVKITNDLFTTIYGISHREALELQTALTRRKKYIARRKLKNKLFYEVLNKIDEEIKNVAFSYGHFVAICEGCKHYYLLDKDPLGPFICSKECATWFIEAYP